MPEPGFYDTLTSLYRCISRMHSQGIQNGEHKDLSAADFMVLRYIASQNAPTMSDIASGLRVTQGTLTVAVNRLVKKGYVERSRMEQDRRIVRASLTVKGRMALREERSFCQQLQEQYSRVLGEERAAEFGGMLKELDQYFRKQER